MDKVPEVKFDLPHVIFKNVRRSFMNIDAKTMVKRGVVNIKTVASDTGMNLIHAKAVSIVRLPNNPTKISITFSYMESGNNFIPTTRYKYFKQDRIRIKWLKIDKFIYNFMLIPAPFRMPNISRT